jgi:integrase/recombinase XerC
VEERILDANPCRGLAPKLPKHLPAHYTHAHLAALLRVCDVRDRAIVLAFLDTGLRLAEFVQLRRDRVDWRTGAFSVIGKGNVERPGWFNPTTMLVIRAYLDERKDDDPALWYGRWGPLTGTGVYQLIKRRCIKAGIRNDVRRLAHSFRSSFGKLYLESGGDLESLRQLYGHATLQMTSYYAQLAFEPLRRKKAAVNTVAQFTDT